MFFDVTRAGTDRRLRVAVAAIAFLDTLPVGSVLHLVGGQSLHVGETVAEIEERAMAARPVTALEFGDRRIEFETAQIGDAWQGALSSTSAETQSSAAEAGIVDWTEVLASAIAEQPAAEQPPLAPKQRRRRQEKAA